MRPLTVRFPDRQKVSVGRQQMLLVPNCVRRSLKVQGEDLQTPRHRHGRGRIANRLVASLILQLSGNGGLLPSRNERADDIGSWREFDRDVLGDTKLSFKNRHVFLDSFQIEVLRDRVTHRFQFDPWYFVQYELN